MVKGVLITTWVNRVLMLLTFGLFLYGFLFKEELLLFWSLMLSIVLGAFQFLAGINLSFITEEKWLRGIRFYIKMVLLYFLVGMIFGFSSDYIPFKTDVLEYLFFMIPIILAFFFTYIVEQVYKLEKQKV